MNGKSLASEVLFNHGPFFSGEVSLAETREKGKEKRFTEERREEEDGTAGLLLRRDGKQDFEIRGWCEV